MQYWNTHRIAEILKFPIVGSSITITEITFDSRKVKPGSLFVAIKGDSMDGHDFIEAAIKQGATAILTEKNITTDKPVTIFHVSSTLSAIRALAHDYRNSFKIPFIGVVGSVGKTTTKELIFSLLKGKYEHVYKTEGSQNGFLGIPMTLLSIGRDAEVAVIEIGIDEIGAMEQHLSIVEPTHLIATVLGPEHLHQLKTVEIAATEELKAFDYALNNEKKLAINLGDSFVNMWFQKNKSHLENKNYLTFEKVDAKFLSEYPCPLPGTHHEHNLLGAVTLGTLVGLTSDEMKAGLKTFKTAYGRSEIHHFKNNITVIGDYYNSNPTSLVAALKLLHSEHENHAVLGDMLELGDKEEAFHRSIATEVLNHPIHKLYLYGPRMKWLQDELTKKNFSNVSHFETHEQLFLALSKNLKPKDHVLIKGSRGMKMEVILKLMQENQ